MRPIACSIAVVLGFALAGAWCGDAEAVERQDDRALPVVVSELAIAPAHPGTPPPADPLAAIATGGASDPNGHSLEIAPGLGPVAAGEPPQLPPGDGGDSDIELSTWGQVKELFSRE